MSLSHGVDLIAEALPYLTQEELSEKAGLYVTTCLKICKKHALPEQTPTAYCVLGELLDRCRSLAEVEKVVTSQVFTDVFQTCLPRASEADHYSALDCLEILFSRYMKQCVSHRMAAEKYLAQFLDVRDESTVVGAAKCIHLLQQTRAPWERDSTPKSSWRNQLQRLCGSAALIMDQLFSNAADIYRTGGYFQDLGETPAAETTRSTGGPLLAMLSSVGEVDSAISSGKNSALANRLCNLLVYIQAMLVEEYPVPKPIRPTLILSLLVRIVSVTSAASAPSGPELAQELVKLKVSALRTLDAMIVCLDLDLLPYSALVFRLCVQALRWSRDSNTRGVKEVRRASYETLCLWLATVKCHRLTGRGDKPGLSLEEELVMALIADYTPETSRLQLTLAGGATPNKNLSKKAKRRLVSKQADASTLSSYTPGLNKPWGNRWTKQELQLKLAALRCLESLLLTSGCFLKHSTHKMIQESLVSQCFEIQRESTSATAQAVQYRLGLLRALEAARVGCAAGLPPPTQYCYSIFSTAMNDSDMETSIFCSTALLAIRRCLHDAPPSLCTPLRDPTEDTTTYGTSEGSRSERNVQALTELLGHDRVSKLSQELVMEKITIAESPEPNPEIAETIPIAVPNLHDAQTQLGSDYNPERAPNNNAEFQNMDSIFTDQIECIDLTDSSENEMQIDENGREDEESDSEIPGLEIVETTSDGRYEDTAELCDKEEPVLPQVDILAEEKTPEVSLDQSNDQGISRKDEGPNIPIGQSQESDDNPIPCGQSLNRSFEGQGETEGAIAVDNGKEKVEGKSEERVVPADEKEVDVVKDAVKDGDLSVEDMLADFVDEVVVDVAAEK